MNILATKLEGVLIIEPDVFGDSRGFFMETYSRKRYGEAGIGGEFVQDNLSRSQKGVLRGLHYQVSPYAQGKLVQVMRGAVLDAAVDIRSGSPTFGQHVTIELSEGNKKQLWIPPGFAHGFAVLQNDTIFHYKCTNFYNKESERGILWNDPDLAIDWKIERPIVSEKDQKNLKLSEIGRDFKY